MDDLTPPPIPAPGERNGHDDDPTLARVDSSTPEPAPAGEANGESTAMGRVNVRTWVKRVHDDAAAHARRTICRLAVPGIARVVTTLGADSVAGAVEAARLAVAGTHEPEAGVTVSNDCELVFVLPEGVSWGAAATTATVAIENYLAEPGASLPSVAVGLAETDAEGHSVRDALRLSSFALTAAQADGGGARAFSSDAEVRSSREDDVMQSVAASLESGEGFRLVYQPKYAVEGRALVGAEALLRHAGGPLGPIGPAEFVPLARRFGMLKRLDRWVVEKAITGMSARCADGVPDVQVSLNVGPSLFFSKRFPAEISRLLDEHGVDAELLQIEVRASDVLEHMEAAGERIRELREIGVTVALDDFGKEEVSPADLRELPIDALKVHRSLILELAESESTQALVRGVLSLAKVLGIETVAAGVEYEAQLELLRSFGCDAVQGFMLSPPLEADAFAERLSAIGGQRSVA